jgi:signal transduction histidine kinase
MPNWSRDLWARFPVKRRWILALLAFTPVAADLAASSTLHTGFWLQFLPSFYYAAIVIAGLEFGWKAGLCFALFGGVSHALIARLVLASPFVRLEGQLLAFLVVGFAFVQEHRRIWRGAKESSGHFPEKAPTEEWLEHVSGMVQELLRETRTPFASIEGAAFLLEAGPTSPGKCQEFIGIISKECKRVHEILAELSEFAILSPLSCRPTDASSLLGEIARLAALEHPNPDVSLRIEVSADLPRMWCDQTRIEQTIVPFVSSAMEAVSDGGKILLAADRQSDQARIQLRILGHSVRGSDPALGRGSYSSTFDSPGAGRVLEARRTVLQHGGTIELDRTGYNTKLLFLTLPLYNGQEQ